MADPSIVTKTLIITEKPSVAQDFAKTLDVKSKRDGYFEGNGYVITWAIGHLLELFEPHEYNETWKKWETFSALVEFKQQYYLLSRCV